MRKTAMNKILEAEFQWYLDHQDELVAKYNGRVLVIKDGAVIGDYDSEVEAVFATEKKYPLGTFLVQRCTPGSEAYTVTVFNVRLASV